MGQGLTPPPSPRPWFGRFADAGHVSPTPGLCRRMAPRFQSQAKKRLARGDPNGRCRQKARADQTCRATDGETGDGRRGGMGFCATTTTQPCPSLQLCSGAAMQLFRRGWPREDAMRTARFRTSSSAAAWPVRAWLRYGLANSAAECPGLRFLSQDGNCPSWVMLEGRKARAAG